jgi:4'-phosphopantetheinyl transferase
MFSNFKYNKNTIENVDVFLLNINDNKELINKNVIPQEQILDIQKYKLEFDRNKRLLSRTFLYTYLNSRYGINNFELEYNQYKKPYLKFHQKIDLNISYSKEYILIAVSDKYQIGADIEYIDKNINHNELKDVVMHPEEIAYYGNLKEDNDKADFFFEVFNTKESIIKSIGMGLYFDVKSINILKISNSENTLKTCLFDSLCNDYKASLNIRKSSNDYRSGFW